MVSPSANSGQALSNRRDTLRQAQSERICVAHGELVEPQGRGSQEALVPVVPSAAIRLSVPL